jgi:hypothetical protein
LRDLHILLDLGCVLSRVQTIIELICVKTQLDCKAFKVIFAQRSLVFTILVLEENIVILPERILVSGAFARLRSPEGLLP